MSNTNVTLQKALAIVNSEVDKIGEMAEEGPLGKVDAAKLTDYIKALILVDKKYKEDAKNEALHCKSTEEIEDLALQALEFLKEKS